MSRHVQRIGQWNTGRKIYRTYSWYWELFTNNEWCMCLSAARIDQLQSCIRGFLSSKRIRESWIRPIKIDIYEVNQELVRGHSGIPYCNYMPSPNQQFDIEIKLLLVRTNPVTSHLEASVSIGGIAYSLIRFRCSCFTYPQWSSKRVASTPATKKTLEMGMNMYEPTPDDFTTRFTGEPWPS